MMAESYTEPLAYTDEEVSTLLRVSKRTVYRLRKSGSLRAVRIGRAVRTPAAEVSRLLAANQEQKENENADQSPS
jgi:excisionase family DNA binding protein